MATQGITQTRPVAIFLTLLYGERRNLTKTRNVHENWGFCIDFEVFEKF